MSQPCNREELAQLVTSIQHETDSTNLVKLVQQLLDAFDNGAHLNRSDDPEVERDRRHCA